MADFSALLADLISGDDQRAEAASIELVHMGEQAFPLLKNLLPSTQSETRWWVVRTLGEYPADAQMYSAEIPHLLASMLQDPDTDVRRCVLLSLTRHPCEEAIPELIQLTTSEDALAARLAIDALVAIGSPAVPALLEMMQGSDHPLRLQAVRVLAEIADPQAAPALFAVLEEDSPWMDFWASEGLERMGIGMTFFEPE